MNALSPLKLKTMDLGIFNISETAIGRLKRFKGFDPDYYQKNSPDVVAAGVCPYKHYLEFGAKEHRRMGSDLHIARSIGDVASVPTNDSIAPGEQVIELGSVQVLCSSKGNFFMTSIARQLCDELVRHGIDVTFGDETCNPEENYQNRIIVAPHEFFHDGRGNNWKNNKTISNSIMLSTEQIQTRWFGESIPYLLESKGVIDMYHHSMQLLKSAGMRAMHYVPNPPCLSTSNVTPRLSRHPLFKSLPKRAHTTQYSVAYEDRPIDVCFFGAESPHRDLVLARCAPFMARLETFLYYRRLRFGPLTGEDDVLVDLATHVCGHSKICLNIHRDRFGAFEWFRIVYQGMRSGSLVLSEHCLPVPGFVDGEHYISVHSRHMGEMIEWLVTDQSGINHANRIRDNCSRFLADCHVANIGASNIVSFLAACS